MRQNNMVRKARSAALDLLCMVVGSIIYAVGVNGFTAPNNIAPGGVLKNKYPKGLRIHG